MSDCCDDFPEVTDSKGCCHPTEAKRVSACRALADALTHVRAMHQPRVPTPFQYAGDALAVLEREGWRLLDGKEQT